MTRIPLVDPDDPNADPEAVRLLRAMGERYGGRTYNVLRGVANNPRALAGLSALGSGTYSSGSLSRGERELAYLTASVVNNCHY